MAHPIEGIPKSTIIAISEVRRQKLNRLLSTPGRSFEETTHWGLAKRGGVNVDNGKCPTLKSTSFAPFDALHKHSTLAPDSNMPALKQLFNYCAALVSRDEFEFAENSPNIGSEFPDLN